jgi:hypothetical protein
MRTSRSESAPEDRDALVYDRFDEAEPIGSAAA